MLVAVPVFRPATPPPEWCKAGVHSSFNSRCQCWQDGVLAAMHHEYLMTACEFEALTERKKSISQACMLGERRNSLPFRSERQVREEIKTQPTNQPTNQPNPIKLKVQLIYHESTSFSTRSY